VTAEYTLHPDGAHERLVRVQDGREEIAGKADSSASKMLLGRSLAIREVDAGLCNGCELEIVALKQPVHDIERLGIHLGRSPRHAGHASGDRTGHPEHGAALLKTYHATPDPKVVVAAGACGSAAESFARTTPPWAADGPRPSCRCLHPGLPPAPAGVAARGSCWPVGRLGRSWDRKWTRPPGQTGDDTGLELAVGRVA